MEANFQNNDEKVSILKKLFPLDQIDQIRRLKKLHQLNRNRPWKDKKALR